MTDDRPTRRRRTVERGEGEVTEWPRGLVSYVPRDVDDRTPSAEEDRTGNRLQLAARLIGLLRSQGEDVDQEVARLREAQKAYAARDRSRATELVDALLGQIEARNRSASPGPSTR